MMVRSIMESKPNEPCIQSGDPIDKPGGLRFSCHYFAAHQAHDCLIGNRALRLQPCSFSFDPTWVSYDPPIRANNSMKGFPPTDDSQEKLCDGINNEIWDQQQHRATLIQQERIQQPVSFLIERHQLRRLLPGSDTSFVAHHRALRHCNRHATHTQPPRKEHILMIEEVLTEE